MAHILVFLLFGFAIDLASYSMMCGIQLVILVRFTFGYFDLASFRLAESAESVGKCAGPHTSQLAVLFP